MLREALRELAEAIRSHPQTPAASRRFIKDFVAWRRQIGILNKVTASLGRERILEHVLYLHYARPDDNPGSGATFERLAALSEASDAIGARAVRTGLRLAQISGLIVPLRSRTDARLRIFEPAEPLLTMTRDYSALAFQMLDNVRPDLRISARVRDEPEMIKTLLARMGAAYLDDCFRRHPGDPLTSLFRLEGARAILTTVLDCHWRQYPLPTAQEFAHLFYVSQSQTRAILKSAEAQGLIRIAPRGVVRDAEPLAQAYIKAQSRYLAFALLHGLGLDSAAIAQNGKKN